MNYSLRKTLGGTLKSTRHHVRHKVISAYETGRKHSKEVYRHASYWVTSVPYNLYMNFLGLIDGCEHQYLLKYKTPPVWYMYPFFIGFAFFFMIQTFVHHLDNQLREHYKDKKFTEVVKQVDNRTLEVTYEYKGQFYSVLVPVSRLHSFELLRAETVVQGETVDVTSNVKRFLGPLEDWHELHYTPKQLGYTNLVLHRMMMDEEEDMDTGVTESVCKVVHQSFEALDTLPKIRCVS